LEHPQAPTPANAATGAASPTAASMGERQAPIGSGATPTDPSPVPFWLRRLGALGWRILVVLAFVGVLLSIAWTIGTVTASVAVAVLASATVAPIVRAFLSRGWGSSRAAAGGTLIAFGVVILVLGVGAWVLVRYAPELVSAVSSGLDALRAGDLGSLLPRELADAIVDVVDGLKGWLTSNIGSIVGSVANAFTVLLFGAFTTFFLLADASLAWRWVTQGLSTDHREAAMRSVQESIERIGGYVRTVAVLAAVEALIDCLLLAVLGVPLAVPLATLVFAAGFVPYLGGIVATAALLLAALAAIGSQGALLLLVLIVIANVLVERFVAVPLRRTSARVNPGIVLVVLPIGAYLGGLLGLVLAVPVAAAVLSVGTSVVDIFKPEPTDVTTEPPLVPAWLDFLAQWSWRLLVGIALIAVAFFVMMQVPTLTLTLVIAAVLAATVAPIVGALVRRGWGRTLSSVVVTLGVTATVVSVTVLSVVSLVANVGDVAGGIGSGAGGIDDALPGLGGLLQRLVGEVGGQIVATVVSVAAAIAGLTIVLVVGVVLTVFLLKDGQAGWDSLTSGMAPWRREELDAAAGRAVSVLGGYMLGTGAVSLFGAVTQYILMVLLGVPLALPVLVLSFFGGYIPYLGSAITTGIAFLLTVSTGNMNAIVLMFVFTIVFNIVQGNVVQPLVFSKAVNIHPAIILLAIPAGGTLGGILGMFLVVPFLGVVGTTWRTVLVVLGRPPDSPDPAGEVGAGAAGPGGEGVTSAISREPAAPAASAAADVG
jgi:predicted PurR-regulated permease PerM